MNLWLDDIRDPLDYEAIGFVWVKTVDEAKAALLTGEVEHASLDHDLGLCDECWETAKSGTPDELLDLKNKLAWNHGLIRGPN